MKNLIYLQLLFVGLLFCGSNRVTFCKRTISNVGKVKIMKVDSTDEYYVFNTNSKSSEYSIVISEKINLVGCRHFGKFIIIDSIQESSSIKMGSRFTGIGFNGLTIGEVKVKNAGVLTKFITNCESFSN